jgi:ABC-2 type transport system ATP-binding protein
MPLDVLETLGILVSVLDWLPSKTLKLVVNYLKNYGYQKFMTIPTPILRVSNLLKTFNSHFIAVDNVSFDVQPGEILGLLGSNGAGKTTIIQMLLSTMTPTAGSIEYFCKNLAIDRSAILQYVSFASTYVRLPGRLTVYENLYFHGKLYGLSSKTLINKINELLKFFNCIQLKDKKAGTLSAGEATRVMLVKAFLTSPRIVLLDEPTASLDPDVAHDVRHFIIRQQREHCTSILLTSHNMDEVTEVCDRVLVLQRGKIIADSTPDELAASVSSTKVRLLAPCAMLLRIEEYANNNGFTGQREEHSISIEVDEAKVADLLVGLVQAGLSYSQVSIEKPTLEDYFLHIARNT